MADDDLSNQMRKTAGTMGKIIQKYACPTHSSATCDRATNMRSSSTLVSVGCLLWCGWQHTKLRGAQHAAHHPPSSPVQRSDTVVPFTPLVVPDKNGTSLLLCI